MRSHFVAVMFVRTSVILTTRTILLFLATISACDNAPKVTLAKSYAGNDVEHVRIPLRTPLFPADMLLPCHGKNFSVSPQREILWLHFSHMIDDLTQFKCRQIIEKSFTTCEHKRSVECSGSIDMFRCTEKCNNNLECCGRNCQSECGQCQSINEQTTNTMISRTSHCNHPCRRTLFCGHRCKVPCSEDHECTQRCEERCQRMCEHATCTKACHTVCAPCAEPCTWSCPHRGTCPLPCGSICTRLPCDKRCTRMLECGHRCPSCMFFFSCLSFHYH